MKPARPAEATARYTRAFSGMKTTMGVTLAYITRAATKGTAPAAVTVAIVATIVIGAICPENVIAVKTGCGAGVAACGIGTHV